MTGRVVGGALSLVVAIATVGLASVATPPSPAVLLLGAGLALAAASLSAALVHGRTEAGPTATACVAWCAPVWAVWVTGPALVRTTAAVLASLLPAALLHLAVRLRRLPVPRWLGVAYAAVGLVALAHTLLADPFLDPDCQTACDVDTILLASSPGGAAALALVARVLAVVLWTVAATVAVVGVRGGSPRGAVPFCSVVLVAAAGLMTEVRGPRTAAVALGATALTVLSTTLVRGTVRLARQRRDVALLAARLSDSSGPSNLATELERALGARVAVRYRLAGSSAWVGPDGTEVDERTHVGRTTTTITRGGEPVAAVDTSVPLPADFEIGPAALVALDSERLRAGTLARVAELRASRLRVVETADAARRQIERDLHDGSQQKLVAASYAIRSAAPSERTARWVHEVLGALAELRDLAHGIYPPVLADAGLAPALESIPDVQLGAVPADRFEPALELTVYLLVARTARPGCRASVRQVEGDLVVEVLDGRLADVDALRDRTDALGGTLELAGNAVRAVLPCGS